MTLNDCASLIECLPVGRLAPQARYRLIPHPDLDGGTIAAVLDEAAELTAWQQKALAAWLAGPLHPAVWDGTTDAYRWHPGAHLFRTGDRTVAVDPDLVDLLRRPMIAPVVASFDTVDRVFGLAADGTLIAAIACLDCEVLP